MKKLPATYYRYRAFNTVTLDELCHDTLHFSHPGLFNDPLDANPTLECDSSVDELRALLTGLVRRRVKAEVLDSLNKARVKGEKATALAEKKGMTEARRQLENIAYNASDPEYTITHLEAEGSLLTRELEGELRRHYDRGVCCFSSTYSSPLLWSHYGDQHRGLCIGYGLDRLPKPQLRHVIYGGSRSIKTSALLRAFLHEDKDAEQMLDRDVLLRKARGWGYEREWRLVGATGSQDSPLLLKEITFGLRCPISVIHTVIQALSRRERAVRFLRMYEVEGRFVLRRRFVDSDELSGYLPKTAASGLEVFGPIGNSD